MKKLLLLTGLSTILFIAACSSGEYSELKEVANSGTITPLDSLSYDWGDVSIADGTVSRSFAFRNDGDSDLVIRNATTSCMCTTASFDLPDGTSSPDFSMQMNGASTKWATSIAPGEEFSIDITFDPMAHGPDGVGPIQRSITFPTSASNMKNEDVEVRVMANVLYDDDYDAKHSGEDSVMSGSASQKAYDDISAEDLKVMLADKDFFLLDVHIPEQEHIEGTDAYIPYDDISSYLNDLPADKNTEIVVYCRSGSMSKEASAELIEMGYTNVKNLEGGLDFYNLSQ